MGKLKKAASNDLQPKVIIHFVTLNQGDDIFKEELSLIADDIAQGNGGGTLDFDTLATELKDVYLAGKAFNAHGGDSRKKFGDCDCTHPPSFGHCIFGACVSVFRTGLRITINI